MIRRHGGHKYTNPANTVLWGDLRPLILSPVEVIRFTLAITRNVVSSISIMQSLKFTLGIKQIASNTANICQTASFTGMITRTKSVVKNIVQAAKHRLKR